MTAVPSFAQLTIEWTDSYSFGVYATALQLDVDDDGNVFVVGVKATDPSPSECFVIKYDSGGTILWDQSFAALDPAIINAHIACAPDGGVYVAGTSTRGGLMTTHFFVQKLDASGELLWNEPTAIQVDSICDGFSLQELLVDDVGNAYISGTVGKPENHSGDSLNPRVIYYQVLTAKVEPIDGGIEWVDLYDGPIGIQAGSSGMKFDNQGNLLNVGSAITESEFCEEMVYDSVRTWYSQKWSVYFLKYDPSGAVVLESFWDAEPFTPNCNYPSEQSMTGAREFDIDDYGNIFITGGLNYESYMLCKFNSSGGLLWREDYPTYTFGVWVDHQGDVLARIGSELYKYGADGTLLWNASSTGGQVGFGPDNTVYQLSYKTLYSYDSDNGGLICQLDLSDYTSHGFSYLLVDNNGAVYLTGVDGWQVNSPLKTMKLSLTKRFSVLDGTEDNNPIANTEFWLIRMQNDIPDLTEDTLGQFTTNDDGEFELNIVGCGEFEFVHDLYNGSTSDLIIVGDSLKIAKHLHSRDAIKHPNLLGTMYSIHLDNAKFAQNGAMTFDTLDNKSTQEFMLDHTELRYNLMVSVEWDASLDYLNSLDANFRLMSNYLYDVSDGQIRLDTIRIFDDKEHWTLSDMWIFADNLVWPHCKNGVLGILEPWYDGRWMCMPRKYFGDSTSNRNGTATERPLDLARSVDYRTKAHEFGHYALGFYDEYLYWDPDSSKFRDDVDLRCLPYAAFRYGFMESQYASTGSEYSSEMSGFFQYELAPCRNTEQWHYIGKSCWDHLESWVEATLWGPDNVYAPILKPDRNDPDERSNLNAGDYFIGPNNDTLMFDYDVGKLVVLTEAVVPPGANIGEVEITVHHSQGGHKANVILINNPTSLNPRLIKQGQTSDGAKMWVIGVDGMDNKITAEKNGLFGSITKRNSISTGTWLYGMAASEKGALNSSELMIELQEVEGDYPLICNLNLNDGSTDYKMFAPQQFSEIPTLDVGTAYDFYESYDFSIDGSLYTANITDSLGQSGMFTIWAKDDLDTTFFVHTQFAQTELTLVDSSLSFSGPAGLSEVVLDSLNSSLESAAILSSSYPVPIAGLSSNSLQVGSIYGISVYPDITLQGVNQLSIRYEDADLRIDSLTFGDESTLQIFHWDDENNQWKIIGGSVNIESNIVEATITATGVYGAFTTDIITDVEDEEHGEILPYRFELSQNYPNPFNPVTTIEYSLPQRSSVKIDIFNLLGQRVRTLVDREESAGDYSITWDGRSASGESVSTGVYFYRFQADDYVETKKMLFLK